MGAQFGVKIKNFQAGSLYQANIGVRKRYDYTNAMFTNSLLLMWLKNNGLKIDKKGATKDILCIDFQYGSRSYEEEISHLEKCIQNKNGKYDEKKINFFKDLKTQAELNKDLFIKKSSEEIRDLFYRDGVEVKYEIIKRDKTVKTDIIHYKMLFRSTGKAQSGSCIFICDRLYEKTLRFIRMGYKMPYKNAPIVEISAYSSLIASTIVGTITINPNDILILNDVDSSFETNIVSVETDDEKHCIAIPKSNYKLKSTLFDGQGLIDESIFPNWGNGYVLLRQHMTKMACFKTRIQQFFKDYYGERYETATIKDMWGNEHLVKDIKLITTNNAVKWCKFKITYNTWCKWVNKLDNQFGVVKTSHKSKLGDYQQMSYQMVNSLGMENLDDVLKDTVDYVNSLKADNNKFLDYLERNKNFSTDYEALIALVKHNKEFARSEYFRGRKKKIIQNYTNSIKSGKILQNGDNLTIVGSPYAMLLYSVGEDVEKDDTFKQEDSAIQCFTPRFENNEYLSGFRSPHNSRNNILHLHNVYSKNMLKYFNLGENCIAINMIHTPMQDRANGSDQDGDFIFATNQKTIVKHAEYCYLNYPTIVNNIEKGNNTYVNNIESYSFIDNKLSKSQSAIGLSSNLAQIAQSYSYSFEDNEKYNNYVCILSVVAQISIDSSKKNYAIDLNSEIKRITKELNIDSIGYPLFWKFIKDGQNRNTDIIFNKNKINKDLICPMNYLMTNLKFAIYRDMNETLPMSYFFKNFQLERNRVCCRKVEELIEKYSLELYLYNSDNNNDSKEEYSELEDNFENLINDIQKIYISKTHIGLTAWLVNRAFCITSGIKRNKNTANSLTNKNKSLLIKTLYSINPNNILTIFSKNLD